MNVHSFMLVGSMNCLLSADIYKHFSQKRSHLPEQQLLFTVIVGYWYLPDKVPRMHHEKLVERFSVG